MFTVTEISEAAATVLHHVQRCDGATFSTLKMLDLSGFIPRQALEQSPALNNAFSIILAVAGDDAPIVRDSVWGRAFTFDNTLRVVLTAETDTGDEPVAVVNATSALPDNSEVFWLSSEALARLHHLAPQAESSQSMASNNIVSLHRQQSSTPSVAVNAANVMLKPGMDSVAVAAVSPAAMQAVKAHYAGGGRD
jgi:hypothetical protein